jgi:hypothetical protein
MLDHNLICDLLLKGARCDQSLRKASDHLNAVRLMSRVALDMILTNVHAPDRFPRLHGVFLLWEGCYHRIRDGLRQGREHILILPRVIASLSVDRFPTTGI